MSLIIAGMVLVVVLIAIFDIRGIVKRQAAAKIEKTLGDITRKV